MSTSGIECVFSAVKLIDTPLTGNRSPALMSKLVQVRMEACHWSEMDFGFAATIWEHGEARRVNISANLGLNPNRKILRSMKSKGEGREAKSKRRGLTGDPQPQQVQAEADVIEVESSDSDDGFADENLNVFDYVPEVIN